MVPSGITAATATGTRDERDRATLAARDWSAYIAHAINRARAQISRMANDRAKAACFTSGSLNGIVVPVLLSGASVRGRGRDTSRCSLC